MNMRKYVLVTSWTPTFPASAIPFVHSEESMPPNPRSLEVRHVPVSLQWCR